MKKILAIVVFTVCFLCSHTYGQIGQPPELLEMTKGEFKTYSSDGSVGAQGLAFSILYPQSFQVMPPDPTGAVVGFAKAVTEGNSIRVFIEKLPNGWESAIARQLNIAKEDAKAFLLSEKFYKGLMTEGQVFLNYMNGFRLLNEEATFFDFTGKARVNYGDELVEIMTITRMYTVYYNNYEIKIGFTRSGLAANEKELMQEFDRYKSFFSYVVYTFSPKAS